MQSLEEVLLRLLDRHAGRVRFLAVGVPLSPRLRRHSAAGEIRPPRSVARNYAEFVPFAASLALDVGIAPLQDTPFNCCKSDLKFQEYAALGVAGVYADLPPYRGRVRHGENGLLAADRDSWFTGLERLVGSPEFRGRLAEQAAREIRAEMGAQWAGSLWEEVLERAQHQLRLRPHEASRPLADVLEQTLQYQAGLERQLKRTVEYQVGKAVARLIRKLAA